MALGTQAVLILKLILCSHKAKWPNDFTVQTYGFFAIWLTTESRDAEGTDFYLISNELKHLSL